MSDFFTLDQGLERLLATFKLGKKKSQNERLNVLMRFITALDAAANSEIAGHDEGLTFNGQQPNDFNKLGHYLVSGGRMFFDLSGLDKKDKKYFRDFLFKRGVDKKVIYNRMGGTHEIGYSKIGNKPFFFEKKLSPFQAFINSIKSLFGLFKQKHFGMNIGLGGSGNKLKTTTGEEVAIRNNGEFGHLYVNQSADAIQIGFEEAAPGSRFIPGSGWHGPGGKGAIHSAFMTKRLKDQKFGPDGNDKIVDSSDNSSRYAWNRVVINESVIQHLKSIDSNPYFEPQDDNNVARIVEILSHPPKNSISIKDYDKRNDEMRRYRVEHGLKEGVAKVDAATKDQSLTDPQKLILNFYQEMFHSLNDYPLGKKMLVYTILRSQDNDFKPFQDKLARSDIDLRKARKPLSDAVKREDLNARLIIRSCSNIIDAVVDYKSGHLDKKDAMQKCQQALEKSLQRKLSASIKSN